MTHRTGRRRAACLLPALADDGLRIVVVAGVQFQCVVVHLINLDNVCAVKSTMGITRA